MLLMASVFLQRWQKMRETFIRSTLAISLLRWRPVPSHPAVRAFHDRGKMEELEDWEWSNPGVSQETF